MKLLFILNDPPYGSERVYNGLRLAGHLARTDETAQVAVFLMGDAVSCAKSGQNTPNGYYNVERMLQAVLRRGAVLLCGTCMDARGLREAELVEGTRRSTLDELAKRTVESDRVLVF